MVPACQIGAIALVVPDYDLAIAFYCGKLGFKLVEDTKEEGGKRWVLVQPPGAHGTALLLARAVTPAQSAAIGNQTGGRVGFFLETTDFTAHHEAMLKAGVSFEEDPRDEPYGTVAVFRDPFGNRWDLLQRRN